MVDLPQVSLLPASGLSCLHAQCSGSEQIQNLLRKTFSAYQPPNTILAALTPVRGSRTRQRLNFLMVNWE